MQPLHSIDGADPDRIHDVQLAEIGLTAMPREREPPNHNALAGLRQSIRAHRQLIPVTLTRDTAGALHLLTGWRRYLAIYGLFESTGKAQHKTIRAQITAPSDPLTSYMQRADENVQSASLSFAEMARLAILAAQDPQMQNIDAYDLVVSVFAHVTKQKRHTIRCFVFLLQALEEDLRWLDTIPRELGLRVVETTKTQEQAQTLRARLRTCRTAKEQAACLKSFADADARHVPAQFGARTLHVGAVKLLARKGMCQIVGPHDFANVPDA